MPGNDLCDETQECRIKYDEVNPFLFNHYFESGEIPLRRKRGVSALDGYFMHPFMEWLEGPGPHRCQVQRTQCRARAAAEWSEWIPTGDCSEECGKGQQEIRRVCLSKDGFNQLLDDRDCGPGMTSDYQECNRDLCQVIGEWVVTGECFIEDGKCLQNATRSCVDGPALNDNCTDGVIPCPTNDCDFRNWGSWMPHGTCSHTCQVGTRLYTRECLDGEGRTIDHEECEGGLSAASKYDDCNTELCMAYSNWTADGLCTVTCGGGIQAEMRACGVLGDDSMFVPPAECVQRNGTCNEQACLGFGSWTDFGPCDSTCTPGLKTRTRDCVIAGTTNVTTGCDESDLVDSEVCNEGFCTEFSGFETVLGASCVASRDSCQVPQIAIERSCIGVGSSPSECLLDTAACTPGSAHYLDILFVLDAGLYIDSASYGLCSGLDSIDYPNSLLNDSTSLPNFVQLKEFLDEFICTFNNISSSETRLAIHGTPAGGCTGNVYSNFASTDPFQTVRELPLDCEGPNLGVTLYCLPSLFSNDPGARPDATDVIIYVASSLATATVNLDVVSAMDVFPYLNLDGKIFAVVYSGTPASLDSSGNEMNLKKLACLDKDVSNCINYLGTTRDDVPAMIETLVTLSPVKKK